MMWVSLVAIVWLTRRSPGCHPLALHRCAV